MNKKILMPLALVLVLSLSFLVSAVSWKTEAIDAPEYANAYSDSKLNVPYYFRTNWNIQKPGWYLLPSRNFDVIGGFKEGTDYSLIDSSNNVDYKYVFSPFTKQYVRCEGTDRLMCEDSKKTIGLTETQFRSLNENEMEDMRNSFSLTAEWYYYSKPIQLSYEYRPFHLERLSETRLKEGWNIINFPAYLTTGELKLGNCVFQKIYLFDDDLQEWEKLSVEDLERVPIGSGMAIQVSQDCNFLIFNEGSSQSPPQIPN